MNIDKSLEIMNINLKDLYSMDSNKLKKIYHQRALKLHPDKGGSNSEFKELQEAYDYLNIMVELNECNNPLYEKYINTLETSNIINKIKKYILKYVNNISLSYINNCNDRELNNIEKILDFYKDKIPVNIYNKINEIIINNTRDNLENFILKPSLQDLFENKIYRLNYKSEIFNVPLWHSELYYDTKDKNEICIKCLPNLSPYIDIDYENNIHICVFENINNIFKNQHVNVVITEKIIYKINSCDINFQPVQQIVLKNKGISKISGTNIYDTKIKSNIVVTLNICQ